MVVSNALHNLMNSITIKFFKTDKSGKISEILPVNINGKLFLPVEKGQDLSIQTQNSSCEKFEMCVGVEEISVSSEEVSTYKSRGYLLNAYDCCIIKGYRQNDQIEAAFAITYDEEMTVKAQTPHLSASPQKKGIIEFLFWEERKTQTPRNRSYSQKSYSVSTENFRGSYRGGSSTRSDSYSKGVEKGGSSNGVERGGSSSDSYEFQATAGMGMGRDINSQSEEVEFYRASTIPVLIVVINFLPSLQILQMEETMKKIDSASKPFPAPLNFQGVKRVP